MESLGATSMFIVRMWSEPAASGELGWRGSIDDVSRKRRIYFSNIGTMCEFIIEQRHLPAPRRETVGPPDA
jgi:hypothetical protein